jgi:hypothetical protein
MDGSGDALVMWDTFARDRRHRIANAAASASASTAAMAKIAAHAGIADPSGCLPGRSESISQVPHLLLEGTLRGSRVLRPSVQRVDLLLVAPQVEPRRSQLAHQ